uniref:Immunoglobulin domain-containing protein n=1 Tax=Melopsittacus undulatus TaxID=13146 RepID=A0A8V5GBI7_MELUD
MHLASPCTKRAGFFPSSLVWRAHLRMPSSLPIEFRLPSPVLSILPGLEVSAGARVTFRCTIAHAGASCFLYLEGQDKAPDLIYKDQEDFNLSRVHKGHEGRYSCQCYSWAAVMEWSDVSNSLDLVVKGETSPKAPCDWEQDGITGIAPASPHSGINHSSPLAASRDMGQDGRGRPHGRG